MRSAILAHRSSIRVKIGVFVGGLICILLIAYCANVDRPSEPLKDAVIQQYLSVLRSDKAQVVETLGVPLKEWKQEEHSELEPGDPRPPFKHEIYVISQEAS